MSLESRSQRVLIVDHSPESREVLRTLLERTGTATLEASGPSEAAELTALTHPALIVYDADSDASPKGAESRRLADTATLTDTPIVLLGRINCSKPPLEVGDHLAKPYHYGHLLRKIAEVLDARRAG